MVEAYIGLGGNIGEVVQTLKAAIGRFRASRGVEQVELSPLYRTAPIGIVEQPAFVNAVARMNTSLSPRELLELCLEVELSFRRVRNERWGPRTIDLDLLLYGEQRIDEPGLIVPHPRMNERAFVLKPLLDLAPDLLLDGIPITNHLQSVADQAAIRIED